MSLFSSLNTSLSGLNAVTTQMQIVSTNISNASTEGYTSKSVNLTTSSSGNGVKIGSYTRTTDDSIFKSLCTALSNDGYRSTQDTYLQDVVTIMGLSGSSSDDPALSSAISDFGAAWSALEASPESDVTQQGVIDAASNLVEQIQSIYQQIDALDNQIRTDINADISDLNSDLAAIAELNGKIALAYASGYSPSDLEDQRDQLVQNVASTMKVTVLERSNGQIALYTPGGYSLVDGTSASSFSYDGTNVYSNANPSLSLNNVLTGGSLQAAVNFRATSTPASTDAGTNVIQKMRSQMDAIITAFTTVDAGPPESFAYAYQNATGTAGEATSIFTGTTISDFAVNSTLLDGSETIKLTAAGDVAATFTDETRTFTADGLSISGASYQTLATTVLTNFQQAANSIATIADATSEQKSYLKEEYANATGVNVDAETIKLTTLQNAYAASAKVIQVIQDLFDVLQAMV